MINFSAIPQDTWVGRTLRAPLRLLPNGVTVPVLQGPLRGKWWTVGTDRHGYWLGSFEHDKFSRFAASVKRGDVVYDIGAHAGYYSLMAALAAGESGQVWAFEPLSRNLRFLRRHLEINRVENVTVVEAAVSDRDGSAQFRLGGNSLQGRLADDGQITVRTVTIDRTIQGGAPGPDVVKIDVEKSELRVLKGATQALVRFHPTIFLATHGQEVHERCCDLLASHGYVLSALDEGPLSRSREVLADYPQG